jgi:hypothetical protein
MVANDFLLMKWRGVQTMLVAGGTVVVLSLVIAAFSVGRMTSMMQATQAPATVVPNAALKTDLDRLVAPIALYPDQLLAQMLLCASEPPQVTKFNTWLVENRALKGSELQDAALVADFGPSFVALALFPDVIGKMAADLAWTTSLGQVFLADRNAVFASIQRLRMLARDAGSLKTTPQQEVEVKTTSSGEQVVVIEPANPQVVYVPQYDPQIVYVPSPTTTTVVVEQDNSSDAAAAAMIGFTAGIVMGAAVNNSYYYGPYGFYGGGYMYNDAWDDYYDARNDARDDWQDHREDIVEERGDRAKNSQEQRTERQENRTENRPESSAQRQERRTDAQSAAAASGRTPSQSSYEDRGHTADRSKATTTQRSSGGSDAFSGYSSGSSTRSASTRGQQSRGGSRGASRGGGGRRR